MKVQLFMPPRITAKTDSHAHLSMVRQQLELTGGIELTDRFPDIVHVFGTWDAQACKMIEQCHRLQVPTVLSTLGQLAPWHLKRHLHASQPLQAAAQKKATQHASALVVWGETERKEVEKRQWSRFVHVIPNAVTTAIIAPEDMAAALAKLYHDTAERHEHLMHARIQDRLAAFPEEYIHEKEVCHELLYLRYRLWRRNIKEHSLETMTHTLNTKDYDEDVLIDMLHQLHEEHFAARMMQVLAEDFRLTEGFMPIDPLDDKQTRKIREAIDRQDTTTNKSEPR